MSTPPDDSGAGELLGAVLLAVLTIAIVLAFVSLAPH